VAETAVSYVFAWHALSDACPKCRALNGREWHDQDLFQDVLWDPIHGNLWDLNVDRSLMHGGSGTCRCQLEVRIHVDVNAVPSYVELVELTEMLT